MAGGFRLLSSRLAWLSWLSCRRPGVAVLGAKVPATGSALVKQPRQTAFEQRAGCVLEARGFTRDPDDVFADLAGATETAPHTRPRMLLQHSAEGRRKFRSSPWTTRWRTTHFRTRRAASLSGTLMMCLMTWLALQKMRHTSDRTPSSTAPVDESLITLTTRWRTTPPFWRAFAGAEGANCPTILPDRGRRAFDAGRRHLTNLVTARDAKPAGERRIECRDEAYRELMQTRRPARQHAS